MLPLTLWLLLPACKTRQVQTNKTDVSTQTAVVSVTKKTLTAIDTSKTTTLVKTQNNTRYSSQLYITTDSGRIQKINIAANGVFTYTGPAKSILYKKRTADQSQQNLVTQQLNGTSTQNITSDSSSQQQTVHQAVKSKTIATKANNSWLWLAAAVLIILIIIFIIVRKFISP